MKYNHNMDDTIPNPQVELQDLTSLLERLSLATKSVPTKLGTWQVNGTLDITLPGPPSSNVHQPTVWA
jgi:hypothetical protein